MSEYRDLRDEVLLLGLLLSNLSAHVWNLKIDIMLCIELHTDRVWMWWSAVLYYLKLCHYNTQA